jgi:predicted RNase H-like nuclease (RuvC/YqgF family)
VDTNVPIWLTVITTVLGLLGGTFGQRIIDFFSTAKKSRLEANKQASDLQISREKDEQKIRLTDSQEAVKLYKDIAETLGKNISIMSAHIDELEKERLQYREDNAILRTEQRGMQKEIDSLTKQVSELRTEVEALRVKVK